MRRPPEMLPDWFQTLSIYERIGGLATGDVRNIGVISALYELPFWKR